LDKGVLPIAKWVSWEVPKPGELFLQVTFSLGAIAEFNAAKMQSPQPEGLTPSAGFRWR